MVIEKLFVKPINKFHICCGLIKIFCAGLWYDGRSGVWIKALFNRNLNKNQIFCVDADFATKSARRRPLKLKRLWQEKGPRLLTDILNAVVRLASKIDQLPCNQKCSLSKPHSLGPAYGLIIETSQVARA